MGVRGVSKENGVLYVSVVVVVVAQSPSVGFHDVSPTLCAEYKDKKTCEENEHETRFPYKDALNVAVQCSHAVLY